MAIIRLILLVVVLGGLTLLLAQNWSPALSLVFLGGRSQQLPLAMWILFSTTAGALTSVLITTLFNLANSLGGQQRQTPFTKATTREKPKTPPTTSPPPASKTEYAASDTFDDWTDNNRDDDWNFDEQPQSASSTKGKTQDFQDSNTYERQQQPQSSSQSGSVYSYNYREPKNTAVGKSESIYDADYRVIIPPYQPPTTNQPDKADEDDWTFLDDDDFEDEDKRPRP